MLSPLSHSADAFPARSHPLGAHCAVEDSSRSGSPSRQIGSGGRQGPTFHDPRLASIFHCPATFLTKKSDFTDDRPPLRLGPGFPHPASRAFFALFHGRNLKKFTMKI